MIPSSRAEYKVAIGEQKIVVVLGRFETIFPDVVSIRSPALSINLIMFSFDISRVSEPDFLVKKPFSSAYSASTQKRDTAPIFWSVKSASVLIVISNFILSSSSSSSLLSTTVKVSSRGI